MKKKVFCLLFIITLSILFFQPVSATQNINITEESIGIVPKLTWGANIFLHDNDNSLYDGLPRSEITLGRIDINLNYTFNASDSPPNFYYLDRMLDAFEQANIEPLLIVDYMPQWLSKNTSSRFYPSDNMTRFNELVETVVDHVKDNVTYYEIWNEPDFIKFWNADEIEYRDLLKNASQVIRNNDPDAKILAPSLSGLSDSQRRLDFVEEVCINASNYFDFFSFHNYAFPSDNPSPSYNWQARITLLKQLLISLNCDKPLWFSEGGINPNNLTWDNRDVMQVAKSRKVLLDNNVSAQVYYPFRTYTDVEGVFEGIYNSTEQSFTPIGKYYQLTGNLRFYGEKLNITSNIQDNVSEISFISVKNPDNHILLQVTNNFSTTEEVQINFENIKNVTIYESSSDQIFDSPIHLGENSSLNLMLKPYSVYLIKAEFPSIDVIIDSSRVIGINNLSVGSQLGGQSTVDFPKSSEYQNLATNVGFKLFRVMDHHIGWNYNSSGLPDYNGMYHPCRYWNETNYSNSQWDWQYVDPLIENITALGAEPLVVLGFVGPNSTGEIEFILPSGMAINSTTGLPYPASFASYCAEWVKHFKSKGWPVKYYEIINEPPFYFGNTPSTYNETKVGYYLELFNVCYDAMHAENNEVLASNDASLYKTFLEDWRDIGGKLDTLNIHKYDCPSLTTSDSECLEIAERKHFDPDYYEEILTPSEAREIWGEDLPVIISESNFAAVWQGGTDPRVQKMVGAVWTALMLRGSIQNNVTHSVYFDWASSKSWEETKDSGGFGFGMINSDDKKPWYPYYVHQMIGQNLDIGDSIINSSSSSSDIRTLAWVNDGNLNILLINKVNETRTISLQGITGQLNYYNISDPDGTSYLDPEVQTGTINAEDNITFNGYTVMILQLSTDSDSPKWGPTYEHTPSSPTVGQAVTISVDWSDNVDFDKVIIYENSSGSIVEHICGLTTHECSGETILGCNNASIVIFGLTSSLIVIFTIKTGNKTGFKSKFKIALPFIIVNLVIFLFSIIMFPEIPDNISRMLTRLGIIPMAVGPTTFTHVIPGSQLGTVGVVVEYYSFANDSAGNSNETIPHKSFVVQTGSTTSITTSIGNGNGNADGTTTTTVSTTTTMTSTTTIMPTECGWDCDSWSCHMDDDDWQQQEWSTSSYFDTVSNNEETRWFRKYITPPPSVNQVNLSLTYSENIEIYINCISIPGPPLPGIYDIDITNWIDKGEENLIAVKVWALSGETLIFGGDIKYE